VDLVMSDQSDTHSDVPSGTVVVANPVLPYAIDRPSIDGELGIRVAAFADA
jgi:hypothetical protein